MFDVDFGNSTALAIQNLFLSRFSKLVSLRLSNTHVTAEVSDAVLGAALQS